MQNLQTLLHSYGNWVVFLNVLVEQAGLPIPSYPTLLATGAVSSGPVGWISAWMLATLACWAADSAWYWAGGRFGDNLLRMICKVSLSRDSCIRQTQSRFLRVGVFALLVSKFLPGAGALTNVMNGYAGTAYRRFVVFELLGALIWAGSGLLLGALFSDAVGRVVGLLGQYGKWGLLLLAVLLAHRVAQDGAEQPDVGPHRLGGLAPHQGALDGADRFQRALGCLNHGTQYRCRRRRPPVGAIAAPGAARNCRAAARVG